MNRKISSTFALALIQVASANEFHLPEDYTEPEDDDFLQRMLESQLALDIDDKEYFGSKAYQEGLSAEEKLQKLW